MPSRIIKKGTFGFLFLLTLILDAKPNKHERRKIEILALSEVERAKFASQGEKLS